MPASKPLNEAVWQAWIAKGRTQDRRSSTLRIKAVKWVSVAGLLAATGLWSQFAPLDVIVRFIVTAGALVVMSQALGSRHYVFAAVFGALALLYNPVAPVLSFAGDWQRAVLVASAAPFLLSLAWRDVRLAHNG